MAVEKNEEVEEDEEPEDTGKCDATADAATNTAIFMVLKASFYFYFLPPLFFFSFFLQRVGERIC